MTTIEIAIAADWGRAKALRLAALREAPDAFGSTLENEEAKPDSWWEERLATSGSTTFIARSPSDVGMAVIAPLPDAGDCGLYAVWVAPGQRGRGVGDALVAAAIQEARLRGFRRMLLDVGQNNLSALRLYQRHGFAATGEVGTMPPPRVHLVQVELQLILDQAIV